MWFRRKSTKKGKSIILLKEKEKSYQKLSKVTVLRTIYVRVSVNSIQCGA